MTTRLRTRTRSGREPARLRPQDRGAESHTAGVLRRSHGLLELAVASGNRLFAPEAGLLRQTHPTHPDYNGHVVAQTPLEYAIALFATGGDAARANLVIRRTADFQDRDDASPTCGNFLWMTHWTSVKDRNAVSFMTPNYAHLWRHFRDRFEPSTQRCLESVFPLALRGVMAHRVPPAYTNIFLLNILSKLELAAILEDTAARQNALADWQAWVAEVSQHGITEYNSPCYTAVDLYALAGILDAAPDPAFRRQVEVMLEYVWTEFAANYHAGARCLTGPMSRAYPSDYLYGNGLSAVIACQQFGTNVASFDSNGGLTPFVGNFAIRHYVVPALIRAMALEKERPVTVRSYVPSRDIRWTNYLDRDFALGSQTGYYGSQEMPLFLAFRTRRKRRSVFFKSDPPLAALTSVQDAGRVLGAFALPAGPNAARHDTAARTAATVRLCLGPVRSLRQHLAPGDALTPKRAAFDASRCLALDLGSVYLGIRAFRLGVAGEEAGVTLATKHGELTIVWPMGGPEPVPPGTAGPLAGFFLWVGTRGAFAGLAEFAAELARTTVCLDTAAAGGTTLAVAGSDFALRLTVPPHPTPPPEFLHDSPYLRLRPGALEARVRQA